MVFSEQQEFPFNLCILGLAKRGGICGQQHSFGLDADKQKQEAADAHGSTLPSRADQEAAATSGSLGKKPPPAFLVKTSVVTLLSTSGTQRGVTGILGFVGGCLSACILV